MGARPLLQRARGEAARRTLQVRHCIHLFHALIEKMDAMTHGCKNLSQ
jgi:hypothetical protein